MRKYPRWDVSDEQFFPEEDVLTERIGLDAKNFESFSMVADRAYRGLLRLWLGRDTPDQVVLAGHGGIFSMMLTAHPWIRANPSVAGRFKNCDIRSVLITAIPRLESEVAFGGKKEVPIMGRNAVTSWAEYAPGQPADAWPFIFDLSLARGFGQDPE